jgi:hypothetical protein
VKKQPLRRTFANAQQMLMIAKWAATVNCFCARGKFDPDPDPHFDFDPDARLCRPEHLCYEMPAGRSLTGVAAGFRLQEAGNSGI